MSTLDDILKSYEAMAASHEQSLPLIDASDFNDSTYYLSPVTEEPGLVYLGAMAAWLSLQRGWNEEQLLQSGTRTFSVPSVYARKRVGEQLWPHHIADAFLPFVEAYVRSMLYANDYQELVVGENGLVDMGQVDETKVSFQKLWARMTDRLEKFNRGSAEWNEETPRPEVELEPVEQSMPGWKAAFLQSIDLAGVPHERRQSRIGKFFALVDHVHGADDPAIIRALLSSFVRDADPSLQEAVLRALYSMPFERVLQEVIEDAPRLRGAGWLPEVLGLWANDYSDEQERYVRLVYPTFAATSRDAVREAANMPDYFRMPWAAKLRDIDEDA